jgi:hypothetical protein
MITLQEVLLHLETVSVMWRTNQGLTGLLMWKQLSPMMKMRT